jgi:hypothetical protein
MIIIDDIHDSFKDLANQFAHLFPIGDRDEMQRPDHLAFAVDDIAEIAEIIVVDIHRIADAIEAIAAAYCRGQDGT